YTIPVAICQLLSAYTASCPGVPSEILGSSNVMGIRFSAPAMKGHPPSACEQVIMATNADAGLKGLSYFLENPMIGNASSLYFMAYTGLSVSAILKILNPWLVNVSATFGYSAVCSVQPEQKCTVGI